MTIGVCETLVGWGRFPRTPARRIAIAHPSDLAPILRDEPSLIARGNGRSYGDAALNHRAVLDLRPAARILTFDPATGVMAAEAGLMLADLVRLFVPRGWCPPVTPGTQFVTLGGMIAADIHGKNHHGAGSFGDHVLWIDLVLADGTLVRCSRADGVDLFWATIGGMGLTGVIVRAAFRLMPIETDLIRQETVRARNLSEIMAAFEDSHGSTYTVAWIDCLARGDALGRSVLYRGDHLSVAELPSGRMPFAGGLRRTRQFPIDLPGSALNPISIGLFNTLYYRRAVPGISLVGLEPFFYPLDAIRDWNRLYGRRGFLQYQCVLPKDASGEGLSCLLRRIADAGMGSFLAVLKLFGAAGGGFLSFPMAGYTLALDFPATPACLSLMASLDAIVHDHGGRLYLAKDARGARRLLRHYPGLARFETVRDAVDPGRKFNSLLSERLDL